MNQYKFQVHTCQQTYVSSVTLILAVHADAPLLGTYCLMLNIRLHKVC